MCEMLGNQYFIARRYQYALPVYEKVLESNPDNLAVKKKLILCYLDEGRINSALKLFHEVISENVGFILDTDPVRDDCPCPQLIYDFENSMPKIEDELNMNITLGILWLYCDLERSIFYFQKASSMDKGNERLNSIYNTLSTTNYQLNTEDI